MPDYSKGKIYKLTAGDLTYYGSTVQTLNTRLMYHKKDAKGNKGVASQKLFESGEEVKIELIENYPCQTEQQLRKREGYYIKNYVCVNKLIAGRTPQQYHQDNKEYRNKYQKEYRENNKEYLLEKRKKYYELNKDLIKSKVNARGGEIIECECGAVIRKDSKARHRNSQQHKKYIDSL